MRKFSVLVSILLIKSIVNYSCEKSPTKDIISNSTDTSQVIIENIADPAECASCHPNHYNEWQTSMHAYSMTDPIFFSLNDIVQQDIPDESKQFCIQCHSPFSRFIDETNQGFDPDNLSSVIKEGIHCDVCHMMNLDHIKRGESISSFNLDRVRRAALENPINNVFHESEFDNIYNFSIVCAPCHDVNSPDGSIVLEQTNLEWDNSLYSAMGIECQDCHMESYSGKAATQSTEDKILHRHYFTGVDYPLIDFSGKDETIQRVANLLQNSVTLSVSAPFFVSVNNNFLIDLKIKNDKTGHDIPSGVIFERQMWIEIILKDALSDSILFSSGLLDDNGDLMDHHSEYVKNNSVEEDTSLILFNGIAYNTAGKETPFFWEATSIQKNTIKAFQSFMTSFSFQAPSISTSLELSVRLRFRTFPPYLFRLIGEEEHLQNLIIFEMAAFNQTITVNN